MYTHIRLSAARGFQRLCPPLPVMFSLLLLLLAATACGGMSISFTNPTPTTQAPPAPVLNPTSAAPAAITVIVTATQNPPTSTPVVIVVVVTATPPPATASPVAPFALPTLPPAAPPTAASGGDVGAPRTLPTGTGAGMPNSAPTVPPINFVLDTPTAVPVSLPPTIAPPTIAVPVIIPPTQIPTVAASTYPSPTITTPQTNPTLYPGDVVLTWNYSRPLGPDEWFEVRGWKRGSPSKSSITWTQDTSFRFMVRSNNVPDWVYGRGQYYLDVHVIKGRDGKWMADLSPASDPPFGWQW